MHTRLAALDPRAAGAILPSDGRRVVRALEVVEISGGTDPETDAGLPQNTPDGPDRTLVDPART